MNSSSSVLGLNESIELMCSCMSVLPQPGENKYFAGGESMLFYFIFFFPCCSILLAKIDLNCEWVKKPSVASCRVTI